MPTPDEWRNASVIKVIEYLVEDIKVLLQYNLVNYDVGVILTLFLGFLKRPKEEYKPQQLIPLQNEWNKRKKNILNWYNQVVNQTQLLPVFVENEDILKLWVELPSHWKSLHTAIIREDREARAEQAKAKKGCNCASKPKPAIYYHWANRIQLLNALSNTINTLIGPLMNFWAKVPLPNVELVTNNLKNAIVLPVDRVMMTTTTPTTL